MDLGFARIKIPGYNETPTTLGIIMFKLKTHAVDITIIDDLTLPLLKVFAVGKRNKNAVRCLQEFFAVNPEAFQPGNYKVEMYRMLPSYALTYDVYRFED